MDKTMETTRPSGASGSHLLLESLPLRLSDFKYTTSYILIIHVITSSEYIVLTHLHLVQTYVGLKIF